MSVTCPKCQKELVDNNALFQHNKMKHEGGMCKKNRKPSKTFKQSSVELFTDIFDDLPDGAFFAMAEELGIDLEDFIEEK